jgi:hypothetical protein
MIELRALRTLGMSAPLGPGRPAHVGAASGLVATQDRIYVVADDELHLAVLPRHDDGNGAWLRLLDGELPLAHKPRKALKPDFEALTWLPPSPLASHGALLALGSGSRANRGLGALLALDAQGNVAGMARRIDLSALHATLQRALGAVNIEGAVVHDDRLILLQRASRARPANLLVHLRLSDLLATIAGHPTAFDVIALQEIELGRIDGVALSFTDGALLADGRIVFTAVAEDTNDSYADGPCAAAAIGLIDAQGRLQRMEAVHPLFKLEGVHATLVASGIELLLVSDADDAAIASTLLAGSLPWR